MNNYKIFKILAISIHFIGFSSVQCMNLLIKDPIAEINHQIISLAKRVMRIKSMSSDEAKEQIRKLQPLFREELKALFSEQSQILERQWIRNKTVAAIENRLLQVHPDIITNPGIRPQRKTMEYIRGIMPQQQDRELLQRNPAIGRLKAILIVRILNRTQRHLLLLDLIDTLEAGRPKKDQQQSYLGFLK